MAHMTLQAPSFAGRDFRVGDALSKTIGVLSRNVLPFSVVTALVSAIPLLIFGEATANPSDLSSILLSLASAVLAIVLDALSQAIVLYGAFEDLRGRPVNLVSSIQFAGSRLLAVIGVALLAALGTGFGFIVLIFPGIMVFTMWYVATPACVVEHLGPGKSLSRSAELTEGHRWKVFGMLLVTVIIALVGVALVKVAEVSLGLAAGIVVRTIWNALFGAFCAILAVVTYHDLRVAKEGVDTDQIAAVFA